MEEKQKESHDLQDSYAAIHSAVHDTESLLARQKEISQEFYQLKKAQKTHSFILQSIDVMEGIDSPEVFSHYDLHHHDFPSFIAKAYQVYIIHQIDPSKVGRLYQEMRDKVEQSYLQQFMGGEIEKMRRVQVLAEKYRMEDKVQTVVLESCLKDLRVGMIYDMNKYAQNIQQF